MSSLHHKATFAAQKNFSSAAFFMPVYLVNPNNCVNTHTHTHTHTHTQERDQYKGTRDARVIYNINAYTQRVCTKFFHNFMHTFFACINEWVVCAKQGFNNV